MNNKNGFALIELLVVVALISIFSAVGVVTYNGYISNAKDKKAQSNFNQIVKTMNNELANCRINPSARLFNSQYCNSLFEPDVNAISSFFNASTLTNPYNKDENVVGSNLCNKGTVAISSSNVSGSYQVQYVSQKKDIKYTKIVESKWSSEKTEQMSKEESYKCSTQTAAATSSQPAGSFDTYKSPTGLPRNGLGAWIQVDRDGNMTASYSGASVCESSYCGSQNATNRTGKYAHLPQGYKVVFVAPASPSGNVSSVCANRACSYNFANGTYTHIPSGRIYDPLTGKPIP